MLHTFSAQAWDDFFPDSMQQIAINKLEEGNILYFPKLTFTFSEQEKIFLTSAFTDPHAKNMSYDAKTNKLWGVRHLNDAQHQQLKSLLHRFSQRAFALIKGLLPHYARQIIVARTSFRPVEISNRKTSLHKDDKRLHIDAFPSSPNQGKRILRVFCNVNPYGEDRIWRVGEPFEKVAEQFIFRCKKPLPGSALLLYLLKITKSYRTRYDHYMLQLHNLMKEDDEYQKNAAQSEIEFSPNSAWIVQTDDVSHAAMRGAHALEQTFYLPVQSMLDETRSPLRILEKKLQEKLI